jgi:hypothetical protein
LRFPVFTLWLALAGLGALTGCDSGTSSNGGPELTQGHYFILTDSDDLYRYDQYFMVLPGNRWEFVEYGYPSGQASNLCQLTRQAGTYRLGDSSLTMTMTGDGESVESCHMTKAQFQAYPMESIPAAERPSHTFSVRSRTAAGFESEDLFQGTPGWKTYTLKADPYGFY